MSASFDEQQLSALARRLGILARQLLIAAARLAQAEPELASDPAYRARVLRDARDGSAAAESAAHLLLTPVTDYSTNELDRLLADLWPGANRGRDE